MIEREKVLETIQPIASDTKVKAWIFQLGDKFYQVSSYLGYRRGYITSVWESTKKGKRLGTEIFTVNNNTDHIRCVNEFIDSRGTN